MQLLIAKQLNKILVLMGLVIVVLFAGIFFTGHFYPGYQRWYIGAFIILSVGLSIFFKWLENSLDKSVIIKMVKAGKIALANIEDAKRFLPLRDSSFVRYWIFEFSGTIYDEEHKPLKKTFYEKMNGSLKDLPVGSVYVTWDPAKPAQIFIVPNVLISSLPSLAPIVQSYEKDSKIKVKYLDAYYNKGMVLRTFKEAVKEYKEPEQSNEGGGVKSK